MSPEEVALELTKLITKNGNPLVGEKVIAAWLDLYRQCLAAVKTKES